MAPLDASTQILEASDLRDIFADALTSFSPLATLVGAESARAFVHEVTNTKQIFLANIAPIDMLGAGNADIYDAATELGCYTLHGMVPKLTKRGGLSCRNHEVNRGVSACAVVKQTWNSDTKPEKGKGEEEKREKKIGGRNASPDFGKIGLVVKDFNGGTVTGRMMWECKDAADYQDKTGQVHAALMSTFTAGNTVYGAPSQNDMTIFEKVGDIPGGVGMLELHWPAPAMVLETNGWICSISSATFLTLFLAVAVLTASPLLGWQSPLASAFLFGGQIILTLGHTCVHVLFRRLRRQTTITIPSQDVADTWTLVDNTWFVSALARRPVSLRTLDESHITLGQFVAFKRPYLPRAQALFGLLAVAAGFIIFYVGARSSDYRTVLIYIFIFLMANCTKGFLINYANHCYYTATNNFGYVLLDLKKSDQEGEKPEGSREKNEDEIQGPLAEDGSPLVIDDAKDHLPNRRESGPVLVPQKPSRSTLIRRHSTSRYSTIHSEGFKAQPPALSILERKSQERMFTESPVQMSPSISTSSLLSHARQLPFCDADSQYFHSTPDPLTIPLPPSESSVQLAEPLNPDPFNNIMDIDIKYRVYAKLAVRHREAMGMFYYSRPEEWAMAAHIIFDAVRRERPGLWGDPVTREYLCQIPLEFYLSPEDSDTSDTLKIDPQSKPPRAQAIIAMLDLALDETRFEDPFWSAGQEITSIIMEHFIHPVELPSESRRATDLTIFCSFVYILTKMLLTSEGMFGSRSLMRAIDLTRAKRPYDDSVWLVVHLRQAAENAAIDVRLQNIQGPQPVSGNELEDPM
ncbi:hypothetical protein VKT23_002658 [Stygiomarasmius scandens]|uniref:Uncharacterized protein n=1 Tax=Marasmiellus scandens TaxID=2682957 RepID=A0ABR1K2N5_9AGAR